MRPVTQIKTDRGFTLIELVIAIFILSIGTLAAVRTLDQSRVQIGGAVPRYLAQSVVENRAAELRVLGLALGQSLPERVAQGRYEWQIDTVAKKTQSGLYEVTLTALAQDYPGAVSVVYITWEPAQ